MGNRRRSGGSQEIPLKNFGDHFFKQITMDHITEGHPKNHGDHFGGEILALL